MDLAGNPSTSGAGADTASVEKTLEKYRQRRRQLEMEDEAARQAHAMAVLAEDAAVVLGAVENNHSSSGQTQQQQQQQHQHQHQHNQSLASAPVYVSARQRRMERLERIQQTVHGASGATQGQRDGHSSAADSDSDMEESAEPANDNEAESTKSTHSVFPDRSKNLSLVDQIASLRKNHQLAERSAEERLRDEETALLAAISRRRQLASAAELAQGVVYTQPMRTSWRPLPRHRAMPPEEITARRHMWGIAIDGEDVPPPVLTFRSMRLPEPLLAYLGARGISTPSPIQMQGLPVALAGRDMIGIASTGTGKTLAFSLPLVMRALEAERRLPLMQGEGPVGLIVCPSRELARQTYEGLVAMSAALAESAEFRGVELRSVLAIGGISMQDQAHTLSRGIHMLVATPGRLKDMLARRTVNLDLCTYLCMDEADRMIDVGFEEDVRTIMSHFSQQRQTVLFSATMPKKIQDFARASLIKPVVVNVSRAGAANMDIIQEVEIVRSELRIAYLLECLQKTPPPVVVFAENKADVDDILEYLLLKHVEAVAIHGSKDQEEREYAMRAFRDHKKDVLVATDVASKGLDFPEIKHVINFDLPREIENYTHRIGRTGRAGKTGVATTFVNLTTNSEHLLLDLKHILLEARQRVPPALLAIPDPTDKYRRADGTLDTSVGCPYCGGLGHRVLDCPKLAQEQRTQQAAQRREEGDGY
ncbi:P-loop containing nucleoside triphosphate hydrolase protein [Kickxella alabastrina]|nr:P-loop containing nucleoside triphosphate hydrolase protein [Kickxella alabastrina]KAI7833265.1 P-loop containing nucleoside triphosphate hydrolase protein [Kickxella alabastrina]